MRRRLFLAAFTLTVVNASAAFAWGDGGHRIICQIAYLELKPEIKARIDALIAIDPKFRTFADGCTWADKFPRQKTGRAFSRRAPHRSHDRSGPSVSSCRPLRRLRHPGRHARSRFQHRCQRPAPAPKEPRSSTTPISICTRPSSATASKEPGSGLGPFSI